PGRLRFLPRELLSDGDAVDVVVARQVPPAGQREPRDLLAVSRRRAARLDLGLGEHHLPELAVRLRDDQLGYHAWRWPRLRHLPPRAGNRGLGEHAKLSGRAFHA